MSKTGTIGTIWDEDADDGHPHLDTDALPGRKGGMNSPKGLSGTKPL